MQYMCWSCWEAAYAQNLSSTYSDLVECRKAVYDALHRMQQIVIAMEDYTASDERPRDKCLADVAACDLYIGIFAWRYGFIPPHDNPERLSITELEYQQAVNKGKHPLIFLLDPKADWPMTRTDQFTEENDGGKRIKTLRKELAEDNTVDFFGTSAELASKVSTAVANWVQRNVYEPRLSGQEIQRRRYLMRMYERYNTVKLPIDLPGDLALHAIFQPLALRRDPLAAEDLGEKQRRKFLGEEAEEQEQREQQGVASQTQKGKHGAEKQHAQPATAQHGEDALSQSPKGRVVILGGPGTGKTTMLKHLVSHRAQMALDETHANASTFVPIYLSLAELASSGKSIQSYLLDIVDELRVDRSYAEVLWAEIERGQAFIALDSLDEAVPAQRPRMIKLVNDLASERGNIWVVGSRFTDYKNGQLKHGQFFEWELLSMTPQLRRELAAKLFPELRVLFRAETNIAASSSEFVSVLEQHPQAAAWGENPLLFSLAAIVFVKTGGLPSSRAALYRHAIEAMLLKEPDPYARKQLLRALTALSLWLYEEKKGRTFTLEDLHTFLEIVQHRSWEEAKNIAPKIITSGIVDIAAHEVYGFRHQTFQEYLAAAELAQRLTSQDEATRENSRELARSRHTYSRWTEVLRDGGSAGSATW